MKPKRLFTVRAAVLTRMTFNGKWLPAVCNCRPRLGGVTICACFPDLLQKCTPQASWRGKDDSVLREHENWGHHPYSRANRAPVLPQARYRCCSVGSHSWVILLTAGRFLQWPCCGLPQLWGTWVHTSSLHTFIHMTVFIMTSVTAQYLLHRLVRFI